MRKIICLTPIKNEAWILETFLKAASIWADYIIIADQGSTDASVKIASSFLKVKVIHNKESEYNESTRQKILLDEARKIEGSNNIFLTLDADEFIVNYKNNAEWSLLQSLEPGTIFLMPWLNVLPGNEKYYESRGGRMVFGYINDGRIHKGHEIHSPRIPQYDDQTRYPFNDLKVLHYQYSSRARLLSKHRWYECFEKIKFSTKNNIDIYRQYHHIDLPIPETNPIQNKWIEVYQENNIDLKAIKDDGQHWWDQEVCKLFNEYGVKHFKKIAIWDVNWKAIYQDYFPDKDPKAIYDPRNFLDKCVHNWLTGSQNNRFAFHHKLINKLLRIVNW